MKHDDSNYIVANSRMISQSQYYPNFTTKTVRVLVD